MPLVSLDAYSSSSSTRTTIPATQCLLIVAALVEMTAKFAAAAVGERSDDAPINVVIQIKKTTAAILMMKKIGQPRKNEKMLRWNIGESDGERKFTKIYAKCIRRLNAVRIVVATVMKECMFSVVERGSIEKKKSRLVRAVPDFFRIRILRP